MYIAALTAFAVFAAILFFELVWMPEDSWWSYLILIAVSFLSAFLVSTFAIEEFIYRKIKVLYKTISTLKSEKPQNYDSEILNLENAEKEVQEFAKTKIREIEQLRSLEKYRKDFLGNVSHELKTPLFSILGYLETLLDGGLDDPKINKTYLHKAVNNVERISNIVNDLLMISQHESGSITLNVSRFKIYDLVRHVFDDLNFLADQKNVRLEIKETVVKNYIVEADKDRIEQVLNNLISNSIKYNNSSKNRYTLIGFYDLEDRILVEVSDNGPGIATEHLPRLFERFYRVDKNRSREEGGTGLGLAIVKHIVEAHNQRINVRSKEGIGSTFGFTLKKV